MLVAIVARELANWNENFKDGTPFHGMWPLDEDGEPVASVVQRGSYTLQFSDPCLPFESYSGEHKIIEEIEDVDGLPYINPNSWDDEGETVTHAEYVTFLEGIGCTSKEEVLTYFREGKQKALKEIAELNEQIGKLVNKIVERAEPFGIDVTIDLGDRGGLDLNGPWDSSSAYC